MNLGRGNVENGAKMEKIYIFFEELTCGRKGY